MGSNEVPAINGERTYHNPIIPGFAPDPSVVRVGGVFYLVTSSFHVFPGIPIYSSTNLQDWALIGHAINRPRQLDLSQATARSFPLDTGHSMVASAGLFAPTIRHHGGTFYIVCTNCFHHEDAWRYENFLISCKDIASDTWSDPLYFPFQGIDPDLFFDDDGRVYVQGSWQMDRLKQPSCTIKQFEIDLTTGKPLTEPREIWGGFAKYDTEGPHIYKRGEWYYLLVAEGGTFEHHLLSIARSRNVAGPYESFAGNPILTADGKNEYVQNVGHGDLFQDQNGNWWAAVLGVRNEPGQPLGRESFLAPVDWPEGGWPQVSEPVMKFGRHAIVEIGFRQNVPHVKRQEDCYIRSPDLSHYHLDGDTEHMITLRATPNSLSTRTGTTTFIGKRQRSFHSVSTTILHLPNPSGNPADTVAGLALYKDHLRHASVTYNSSASQVQLNICNSASRIHRTETREIASKVDRLGFRIVASPENYMFFFRDESASGSWVELGCLGVQDFHAREFTGPIFGIFATGDNRDVVFSGFVVEQ